MSESTIFELPSFPGTESVKGVLVTMRCSTEMKQIHIIIYLHNIAVYLNE